MHKCPFLKHSMATKLSYIDQIRKRFIQIWLQQVVVAAFQATISIVNSGLKRQTTFFVSLKFKAILSPSTHTLHSNFFPVLLASKRVVEAFY
jgi:hypothetical protein